MPGGFVEGTTRRVVMFVQALCGTSRVLRVVVVDRRRRPAAPRRPRGGPRRARFVREAGNYASLLNQLKRYEEAKSLLRRQIAVARRVLDESHELTLKVRWYYAEALYEDDGATVDDLREAVTTLEDTERIARRVFGGAHPTVLHMEVSLQNARAVLRAHETPSGSA